MVISSKGRYALRIMVYLAGKPEGRYDMADVIG